VFTRSPLEGKILTPPHSLGTGGGGRVVWTGFLFLFCLSMIIIIIMIRAALSHSLAFQIPHSLLTSSMIAFSITVTITLVVTVYFCISSLFGLLDRQFPACDITRYSTCTGLILLVLVYHKGSEDTVAPPIAIIIIIINGIHQVFINNSVHSLLFLLSPHPSKIVHHTP